MISTNGIVLIGGGGHCRSVVDSLRKSDKGRGVDSVIVDPKLKLGNVVYGCRVVGTDDDLRVLFEQGYKESFITVGCIKSTANRRYIYNAARDIGFSFATIIDESAVVAGDVDVEMGVYVAKGTIINTGSWIGICAIINTGAIIEHDCRIGAFSHIAAGAVICGGVQIGEDVLIGANATVIQGTKIGDGCIVGAGSTILADVPKNTTVVGVWKGL